MKNIKSIIKNIPLAVKKGWGAVKTWLTKLEDKPLSCIAFYSFLLNLVMEIASRHSFIKGVLFIFTNPVAFLLGCVIIAVTLLPTVFVKCRRALRGTIMLVWLGMGVTNCIVGFFRVTPFSAMDIALVPSVFTILDVYLKLWQIILLAAGILLAMFGIVCMFLYMPKDKTDIKKALITVTSVVVCFGIILFTSVQSESISGKFSNLGDAYDDYGFSYCFTASIFSRGITKPTQYSEKTIQDIETQINSLNLDEILSADKVKYSDVTNPNIIMVQLESFVDANEFSKVKFSSEPVPNFRSLKNTCVSGKLTVPSIGAGTANTEFEVLTGMNKQYFGIGEYPYKTILKGSTCESLCYELREDGYTCHAIHNHYGTFYDRDVVFSNLGFDTFTSVEYMHPVPQTPVGWEKDEILLTYIDEALKSTQKQDFVFTISVQPHGKYPTVMPEGYEPVIKVTGGIEDEARKNEIEYYVNMVHETDAFVGKLIAAYSNYNEPVMVILYGDHQPNIELTEEDIGGDSLLDTEYVIWTNYDMEAEDMDLTSYQLSAYAMRLCNKKEGILTRLHQNYIDDPDSMDYEYMLEMLEYDMLYGEYYIYGSGENKNQPTDMKLGIRDIKVTGCEVEFESESEETTTTIKGENFNIWSVVYVNGTATRTIFKNSSSLIIEDRTLEEGDIVTVVQVTKDKKELSESNEFVIQGAGDSLSN